MNKQSLFGVVSLLAATVMGVANVSAAEKIDSGQSRPLPRVLLIGDSICGGYQQGVKKRLAGKAVVVKPGDNAGPTWNGLEKLDVWLGDGKWDVIHFNWGLWDVAYRNPESKNFGHLDKVDGKLTTSLPDYEKNLRTLVGRLKKTGATLVWASTTPVPDGEPGRIKGDEVKYNAMAAKIMAENGIAIDDLHAEVIRQGRPKGNNVHDTGDLSTKVADSIVAALASRGTVAKGQEARPNFLIILADDLDFSDLGGYGSDKGWDQRREDRWQNLRRMGIVTCSLAPLEPAFTPRYFKPSLLAAGDEWAKGFIQPPDSAKPLTWWHWLDGNITGNSITAGNS